MKNYNEYKHTRIDWIGKVPTHWSIKKLSLIFDFTTGFTPSTSNNEFYDNGNIDWVTISDMKSKFISGSESKITVKATEGKQIVPKGSLMYSFKLSVGKVAFAQKDIYTNEAIFSIFPNENICLEYYYYLLPHVLIFNANENIYGAKILNQEIIKASKLIVPPLHEQRIIANFLNKRTSQIEKLIDDKVRLMELLNEESICLVNQVITKGFDSTVPMKDSGVEWIGKIPAHWLTKRIEGLSESITGYAFKSENFSFSEGVKIVRGDNVTENSLRWGDKTRLWENVTTELEKYYLKPFDIVIGMDGSKVGKNFAMINGEDLPLLLVQRVARIRATNPLLAKYIKYCISSYNFKYHVNVSKTDPAIPHITLKNITDYRIFIPPTEAELREVLVQLDERMEKLDLVIKQLSNEIEFLKEYKTALISEVVTGKVDVRNEVLTELNAISS